MQSRPAPGFPPWFKSCEAALCGASGEANQSIVAMGAPVQVDEGTREFVEARGEGTLYYRERPPGGPFFEIISSTVVGDSSANPLTVRIGFSAKSLNDLGGQLFRVLFTIALVLLAVSFLMTRWFTSMIVLPVNELLRCKALAIGHMEESSGRWEPPSCCHATEEPEGAPGDASADFLPSLPPLSSTEGCRPWSDPGLRKTSACEQCSVSGFQERRALEASS